ncbi:MAG: MFS transporter [Actinobacteria bacterium]|uniref:Unannotated protein n=1 Tax=freshwater metagenome TaxID=449393 RepID=A0A6J7KDK8_9ZZZZ|nr:MFS transporter [Actinomycetota bacterium]
MAALVTPSLVHLVRDSNHRNEQPPGSEPIDQVGFRLREERSQVRVRAAVIVRESRASERASTTRRRATPCVHGSSVRRNNHSVTPTTLRQQRVLLLSAIALVAFNLRIALTSLPTVVLDIQQATGLDDIAIGALTTLPVVAMGAFALAVPAIARQFGRSQTVWLAMALLVVAMTARLAGEVSVILAASAMLAGIGIALAAGLVPGIIREQAPDAVGMATGLWTASMFAGATVGAAMTVPIAEITGSWTIALAVWAIPAAIAWIVWTIVEKPYRRQDASLNTATSVSLRSLPWRDANAWALTTYLMLNSVVFYSAIAWLAPSYAERGWSLVDSGVLFGLFSTAQILAALLLPPLAQRMTARRTLLSATVVISTATLLAIGFAPDFMPIAVLMAFGLTHSGGFTIALAMLSEYSRDAASSARLTAMAFSVTFLVAALGPLISGAVLQWSGSWPLVYGLLALVCAGQLPPIIRLRRGIIIV